MPWDLAVSGVAPTAEIRGRRGRATDPEWKARRRLLRNHEDLSHEQFAEIWHPLLAEGEDLPHTADRVDRQGIPAQPPQSRPAPAPRPSNRPRTLHVPHLVQQLPGDGVANIDAEAVFAAVIHDLVSGCA
ncbi:hypothetical protein ABZW18_29345 [Streptomyces sp. NPDC004647]|uniref:hypothetical protein n=1 Tax=Streptomyces sp. NPDC004647 TaxID=3154671 RepID=UPI0033BDB4DA